MIGKNDERCRGIVQTIFRYDILNKLPRTGFAMRGIPRPETIGEHCFGVSVLTLLLADALTQAGESIDRGKALSMAILHESGEILVGDLPHPATIFIGAETKRRAERTAGGRVLHDRPGLRNVVDEFEKGATLEARLVRAADKLQMMIKVMIYESEQSGYLEDFWAYSGNFVEVGIPLADELFAWIRANRGRIALDYLGLTASGEA